MAEKTIGQVLRDAREDMGLSISDVYNSLKIHRRYIRALERDRFEVIPGKHQAKSLLSRYCEYLNLDVGVILEAYDSHEPLRVYSMPVNDPRYAKLSRKKRPRASQSYLPFLSLLVISLLIVGFVGVTIWRYSQDKKTVNSFSDKIYQLASDSSSTTDSSSSDLIISSLSADNHIEINQGPDKVALTLKVTEGETWVAVSETDVSDGVLLSSEQPSITVTLDRSKTASFTLQLQNPSAVTVNLDGTPLDLSQLPDQATVVTLDFK